VRFSKRARMSCAKRCNLLRRQRDTQRERHRERDRERREIRDREKRERGTWSSFSFSRTIFPLNLGRIVRSFRCPVFHRDQSSLQRNVSRPTKASEPETSFPERARLWILRTFFVFYCEIFGRIPDRTHLCASVSLRW